MCVSRSLIRLAFLCACVVPAAAWAADPPTAHATVTDEQARRVALAQVPGGKVISGELEHEHGRWIWSYDIRVDGKSGIEEVQVDAHTAKVVNQHHETPRMERREKRAEQHK
jgi:hypothetical protein